MQGYNTEGGQHGVQFYEYSKGQGAGTSIGTSIGSAAGGSRRKNRGVEGFADDRASQQHNKPTQAPVQVPMTAQAQQAQTHNGDGDGIENYSNQRERADDNDNDDDGMEHAQNEMFWKKVHKLLQVALVLLLGLSIHQLVTNGVTHILTTQTLSTEQTIAVYCAYPLAMAALLWMTV